MTRKTVAIALSGGVDSAASAYCLKKQGYNIFGITMKLFEDYDVSSAKYVADILNIPHYIIELGSIFEKEVINVFVNEYLEGKTPNPCILCNMKFKYNLLLKKSLALGADYMALGHYANILYNENDSKYHLYKSKVSNKDQSYFLYHLKQEQLKHLIIPLANFESKNSVRDLIKDFLPEISKQKDSLNICFTKNLNYTEFISSKIKKTDTKGNFVDKNGNILGTHKGIYHYTIGQKRGLEITTDKTMYVLKIDAFKNEIVLGSDNDTYKDEIYIKNVTYIDDDMKLKNNFNCQVKLCQWGYYINCTVFNDINNCAIIKFHKSERAPAPGQSAVFYIGDEVLGGGIII